jgi:hypothetical protein
MSLNLPCRALVLLAAAWLGLGLATTPAWADEAVRQVEGQAKARLLAALAGLAILGFGMVALVWLGARITQRYRHGTSYFRPTPRPSESAWAEKPLIDQSPGKRSSASKPPPPA